MLSWKFSAGHLDGNDDDDKLITDGAEQPTNYECLDSCYLAPRTTELPELPGICLSYVIRIVIKMGS